MKAAVNEEALIETAIAQAKLPDYVREVLTELDIDSTGAPAVRVYVILTDKEARSPQFGEHTTHIRDLLREAIQETGVDRWPYIRFRTVSEQRSLALEDED